MNVRELNRQQLDELKRYYVCETLENPTWQKIVDSTEIADEVIYNYYDGICFANDDFLCSCG